MTLMDLANLFVAIAAFGVGGALWWTLRALRPWRRAMEAHAPRTVSGPLSCVAAELSMLPHVFFSGATARLSTLIGNELLTASLTGVAGAIAAVTLWHMVRAAFCVRRAIRGVASVSEC